MAGTFFDVRPQSLSIRVRLQPAGRSDQVLGLIEDTSGQVALKASVTKAPEGGKANAALIKVLAKEWRVAKTTLEVIQGATGRSKVLSLAGDSAELAEKLRAWAQDKGWMP